VCDKQYSLKGIDMKKNGDSVFIRNISKRGTIQEVLNNGQNYVVRTEISGKSKDLVVSDHDVVRYVSLSVEDADNQHALELPIVFEMAKKALENLLPSVSIAIVDGSISSNELGVNLDPTVYTKNAIGAIKEIAGWQVSLIHYSPASHEEPEDYTVVEEGHPTHYPAAVRLFVVEIFKRMAMSYWENLPTSECEDDAF
jgi:hypothetical protein